MKELYSRRGVELAEKDEQIRGLMPSDSVRQAIQKPGLDLAQVTTSLLEGYADRDALGVRSYERRLDPETGQHVRYYLPHYECTTYRELHEMVKALANAFHHHQHCQLNTDDFVVVLGNTSPDFLIVELAAWFKHTTTVPLQSTMPESNLADVLDNTSPSVLAASVKDLPLASRLAIANKAIHSVIAIDYDPEIDEDRRFFAETQAAIDASDTSLELFTLQELIDFGKPMEWKPLPAHPLGEERMACLCHSSGSTGTPKGAIFPERLAKALWTGGEKPGPPIVGFAYAPMNHLLGRGQVILTLASGGTVYFTADPIALSTLFEDIRLARPTYLAFFPRVFDLIYQHYQNQVAERVGENGDHEAVDQQVRAEMRAGFLGDRLIAGNNGGGLLSPEIQPFMEDCFGMLFFDWYGNTEAGPLCENGRINPDIVMDFKLRDVPELGYYSTDKPYPRGEMCAKTVMQVPGYYKQPEANAKLFDSEGFLCTGDIMELREPDLLVYIDRTNDVQKLSQGEFVTIAALTTTFEKASKVIEQIYIYGSSNYSYLLAVVVPDMDVVANKIGPQAKTDEIKALIMAQMQEVAKQENLRTFELPRDIIIEMEPFSQANGLISSIRKRIRPKLREKYSARLEALYSEIETKRTQEIEALKDPDSPLTTLEKIVKALEAVLGVENIDPQTTHNFIELGGDSLGSVQFSTFIEEILGISLPVNILTSPAGSPIRWAQLADQMLSDSAQQTIGFDDIHGKDSTILKAEDLCIERFMSEGQDNLVVDAVSGGDKTVLLTGANGFLGRFLCLAWLERLEETGGKLICLIRATDELAAKQRLDAVFEGLDSDLERHYHSLADKHLDVIAGDAAEADLGLSQADWDRLATDVDHIVHAAALVNHRLSYRHLFGPNVLGTAQLVKLALTQKLKRFDFVSTIAVCSLLDNTNGINESSPLLPSVPLTDDSYAAGYATSKWACEVLIQDAQRRFGLPGKIFRGDMMMPHSAYRGQVNVPDVMTRLLYSIVITGLAPDTFYELADDGSKAHAHYDGLPVDYVADSIVGIGQSEDSETRVYHVSNYHHDDGISLDVLVDWVESAGFAIERIPDFDDWEKQFETRINTLAKSQRQHSILELMHSVSATPNLVLPGSQNYQAGLKDLSIGPEAPHLTEAYIHKYLDDLRDLKLFEFDVRIEEAI